jgi:hypothetical protein
VAAVQKLDIQGVHFTVVADLHNVYSKEKRVYGDDDDFFQFFLDNRRHLFYYDGKTPGSAGEAVAV